MFKKLLFFARKNNHLMRIGTSLQNTTCLAIDWEKPNAHNLKIVDNLHLQI